MKIAIRKNRLIAAWVIIAGVTVSAVAGSLYFSTYATLIIWIMGVFFSLLDIKKRFVLFSFHVGFFVFLYGGVLLSCLTGTGFDYLLGTQQAKEHTLFSLVLSLGIVDLVALYRYGENEDNSLERKEYTNVLLSGTTRQIVVLVMIISYICELVIEISVTRYRLLNSYLSLESDVKSNLPTIITLCASVFYIAFFTFLSTMPSKKAVLLSFAAIGLLEGIILISGERGEPLSVAFVLIFYVLYRNKLGISDIRIEKRHIVLLIVIIPFLLTFLQTLASTRVNRTYESSSYGAVFDFFETQGKSVTIISRCYDSKDEISEIGGNTYVLGEVRNYLKTNLLSRVLLGTKVGNRYEQAISGDKFSATTNYLFLSSYSFNRGVGGGTTYIAEVYHDGGYALLILANIFIGLLIYSIDSIDRKSNYLLCAISMNIMRYLVLIPRGYMLAWLTDTFAVQNLMLLVILTFINQVTTRQEYNAV